MGYFSQQILPYIVLGGVASAVSMGAALLGFQKGIQSLVSHILGFFKINTSGDVGKYALAFANFLAQGIIIGVSIYVAARFVSIGPVGGLAKPVTSVLSKV